MSILVKNGRLITAEHNYQADIYIKDQTISLIGQDLDIEADRVIDAAGRYVIPGGIDVHTHLDMPLGDNIFSSDDFTTGTIAAAFGGTTTVIDFATQLRGQQILDALTEWHNKARGKAVIDYGFHMIITDIDETTLPVMGELIDEGVSSFKLFMAYPQSLLVDDATMFKVFQYAGRKGALVGVHAENGSIIDLAVKKALSEGKTAPIFHALTRSTLAEAEAVSRAIAIAEMADAPVNIVHVSCADALEKIAEAQYAGKRVFAETCPQYLFLSLDNMGKPGFEDAKFVFTPPVREKWNQEILWKGLQQNSLQVVATDHCPFNYQGDKERGKNNFTKIPNGGPGIEHRLQLLYHGGVEQKRFSLNRWVELCCTNPAKLFGLFPKKGTIAIGSDADLVIWNPDTEVVLSANTHHMRVDYSMYEGLQIKGNAETVLSRGEIIIEHNACTAKHGRGNYLKRSTGNLL